MTAGRDYGAERGRAGGDRASLGAIGTRLLSWSIAAAALALAALVCAGALAPRLTETLQPGAVQPDGDRGFMQGLSLKAPWPWVVPSHPDDALAAGDVAMTEDGAPFGRLDPSHADIRRLGAGRYDLWQGTLWFSTPGPDPRDPGHSYAVSVAMRLSPGVADARFWVGVALLLLVAVEALCSSAPSLTRGWVRHGAPTRRAGTRLGRSVVTAVVWSWGRRWRFRAPFLAITFGGLAILAVLASHMPVPIYYQPDSYSYIEPGLRLAEGQSMGGTSLRDLGYPLLTYLAVRLGSITDVVPLQFGAVLLAIGCMLLVMATFFRTLLRNTGFGPGRVPLLLTASSGAVGLLYVLMLFSHDEFVINIYSLMAETPHFLPMAAALLCFTLGWASPSAGARILLLAAATVAAFVSVLFKPSSTIAFALCAVSLASACVMTRRSLKSPTVIAALALTVVVVGGLQRIDAWIAPPGSDFGAKILFCNHLDVVDGHFEPTTPERARIKGLIAHVLSLGPHGWPEQGFDGDECTFSQPFTDAILASARSENLSAKDWQMHEFIAAVLAHPLRYTRHVARQYLHFVRYPLDDADEHPKGSVADVDWKLLKTYSAFNDLQRERFTAPVPNWFGDVAPDLVRDLKNALKLMASTFAAVVLFGSLLALWEMLRLRRAERLRAEAILLAVGAFTAALPMTVALSHSFDVGRYSVDILPFTVLWWCLGLVYILRVASRGVAAVFRSLIRRFMAAG